MIKFNAKELANYIIYRYNLENKEISKIKLHKILYYVYGYIYKFTNQKLFAEEFYNCPYGPIIKDVHYSMGKNDFKNLSSDIDLLEKSLVIPKLNLNIELLDIINYIINIINSYTDEEIIFKSKMEKPCYMTEHDVKIKDTLIHEYFLSNDPLKIQDEAEKNCCDFPILKK